MNTRTRKLVSAINLLRGMIQTAQGTLSEYLQPDGTAAVALDKLLGIFDGPEQRAAEAFAQDAVLAAESVAPEFATQDLTVQDVTFWFVWTKTGAVPRRAHDTELAALTEAARLARKNPGRKFIVLEATHKLSFTKGTDNETA